MTPRIIRAEENALVIRPSTLEALRRLDADGAWREDEVAAQPVDAEALADAGLITQVDTVMGRMTLLTPRGQALIGLQARQTRSAARQLDRAYVRLCLAELGWSALPEVQNLRQYDTSGRMTAVMTNLEGGRALVAGKLPAGHSTSGLRQIVERLRSQALSQDFWVVVLTPRPRRGQAIAARHPAWLRVIPMIPGGPAVTRGSAMSRARMPEGPILQPGDEQRFLDRSAAVGRPYGTPWLDILRQPRAGRVEACRQALEVDGVLTEQQVQRYFGLDPQDLEAVRSVEAQVRPVHSRPSLLVRTRLYLREPRLQYRDWNTLAHGAGIAEMRLLRHIPPDPARYRSQGLLGRLSVNRPDAVYDGECGEEALEYDTGSYPMAVVEKKLGAFRDRGLDTVIWGVPAGERQRRLAQALDITVLNPRWF